MKTKELKVGVAYYGKVQHNAAQILVIEPTVWTKIVSNGKRWDESVITFEPGRHPHYNSTVGVPAFVRKWKYDGSFGEWRLDVVRVQSIERTFDAEVRNRAREREAAETRKNEYEAREIRAAEIVEAADRAGLALSKYHRGFYGLDSDTRASQIAGVDFVKLSLDEMETLLALAGFEVAR